MREHCPRTCVPQCPSILSIAATWRTASATPGIAIAPSTLWQGRVLSKALAAAAAASTPPEPPTGEAGPQVKDRYVVQNIATTLLNRMR